MGGMLLSMFVLPSGRHPRTHSRMQALHGILGCGQDTTRLHDLLSAVGPKPIPGVL
jgi:hypothetical protein